MKIGMVSTFGRPAFGVSPYADQLLASLREHCGPRDTIEALDYQRPYPNFLYPAKAPKRDRPSGIHWAKPTTWRWSTASPDIVHVQYWTHFTAPYLLRLARDAKRQNARIVLTLHNAQPHEHSGLMRKSENRLLAVSDAVITHIPDEKISTALGNKHHVIPHGISLQRATAPSQSDYALTALSPTRRYLLFFGNIRPYKGVTDLLQVWSAISSQFPEHDLIIAGRVWSGSTMLSRMSGHLLGLQKFERTYRAACQNIPDGRAHFAEGYLSEEYIDAICRIAELAVFPYKRFDAQSGAATRVAGLGKTMLVSDQGGLHQLTSVERNVFHSDDLVDLEAKLSTLLKRNVADIRQDELSQHRHLQDLSWAPVASKHWDLYTTLTESGPSINPSR